MSPRFPSVEIICKRGAAAAACCQQLTRASEEEPEGSDSEGREAGPAAGGTQQNLPPCHCHLCLCPNQTFLLLQLDPLFGSTPSSAGPAGFYYLLVSPWLAATPWAFLFFVFFLNNKKLEIMHFSNFFLLSSLYNPHVAATSRKFITSFYYVCLCLCLSLNT